MSKKSFRLHSFRNKLFLLTAIIIVFLTTFGILSVLTDEKDVDASNSNGLRSVVPSQMTTLSLSKVFTGALADSSTTSTQSFAITDKYFIAVQADNSNGGWIVATSLSNPSSTPAWQKKHTNLGHGNGATWNSKTNEIMIVPGTTDPDSIKLTFNANNGEFRRMIPTGANIHTIAYDKEDDYYAQMYFTEGAIVNSAFEKVKTFDADHPIVSQDIGYFDGYIYLTAWSGCNYLDSHGRSADVAMCRSLFKEGSNVIYQFNMNGDFVKAFYIPAGFGEIESMAFDANGTAYVLFNASPDSSHYSVYKINNLKYQKVTFANAAVTKTVKDGKFTNKATSNGNGSITYGTSNPNVATVNASTGEVTIKGVGTAKITAIASATADYNISNTSSYTLTVTKAAQTVSFTSAATTKTYGDANFTVKATTTGDGAISYASSNTAVATINASTGAVTIKGAGTTTITATAAATTNYNVGSKSYTLTVTKATQTVSFTSAATTKTYGDANFTVKATTTGDGAISYASSNTAVATINASTGVVTIKGAGTTTITATAAATTNYNTANKTYTLTVKKSDQTVNFTAAPTAKTYGDASFNIKATTTGDGSISYASGNTSVATVDASTGAVTIKGAGTTEFTATAAATTNYNSANKKYTLTVNKANHTITFADETEKFELDYGNMNFTNKAISSSKEVTITYKSSNEKIVTVDKDGRITPLKSGEATITASGGSSNYKEVSRSYKISIQYVLLLTDEDGLDSIDPEKCVNPAGSNYCAVAISSTIPLKEGRFFLGWSEYTDAEVETYSPNDVLKLDDNKTLYAVWTDGSIAWEKEQQHVVGNGENAVIKVNMPLNHFTRLEIDDKEVAKGFYELTSGSTILTLHADYLDTLDEGTHKLALVFDEESIIETEITIKMNPNKSILSPNTGDNLENNTTIFGSIIIFPTITIVAIVGVIYIKKVKSQHRKFD